MMYTLLFILGVVYLIVWLVMLFQKSGSAFPIEGMEVMRTMETPAELNPKEIQRNLTQYADDSSALQKYVNGLRERFEGHVEIKVIEQRVRKANVRKELLDAVIAMLRSERELQRLPSEEELKDAQIEVQLLEAQEKQQKIEWRIEHGDELRERKHRYKLRKLDKKTADLDRKPAETNPRPKPKLSREQMLASRLEAQRKIKKQIQDEEQEELLKFRLEMRPDPAKDKEVYKDEAVWLADWREVGGDQELFALGEYENIKKRHRNMLNDALDKLN